MAKDMIKKAPKTFSDAVKYAGKKIWGEELERLLKLAEKLYPFITPGYLRLVFKNKERHLIILLKIHLEKKTTTEVSAELFISKTRVSQIRNVASRMLRANQSRGYHALQDRSKHEEKYDNLLNMVIAYSTSVETAFDALYPAVHIAERALSEAQKFKRFGIIKIDQIDISTRTTTCLKSLKIETLNEAAQRGKTHLLRTKNLGPKSLKEIASLCDQYNIRHSLD